MEGEDEIKYAAAAVVAVSKIDDEMRMILVVLHYHDDDCDSGQDDEDAHEDWCMKVVFRRQMNVVPSVFSNGHTSEVNQQVWLRSVESKSDQ